jgi:WD40 repeat protein
MSRTGGDDRASLPLELADRVDRVDRICDAFEAEWRAGRRPRIEDYLGSATGPERAALLPELLAAELELRRDAGEWPSAAEYRERFSGDGPLLDDLLDRATTLDFNQSGPGGLPRERPLPAVPGYEIIRELGRGGMGVVYEARQTRLGRPCALKMVLAGAFAGSESVARFLVEAETVARLRHPHVVQIHAIGEHEGLPYIELELLDGGSLADRLDGEPWASDRAAELVATLARATDEVHRLGVVHRDLKPANILLSSDGTAKIADFGIARSLGGGQGLTRTESLLGSPSYMAPEQAEGKAREAGPAADLYALGAILYELLTGRPPFRAPSALETLAQVRMADPVPPGRLQPGLPRDIETVCLKCLQKPEAKRYASAGELAEDLERFLQRRPVRARPVGSFTLLAYWCRRNPGLTAASGLAALALTAALLVSVGFGIYQSRASTELRKALRQSDKLSASLALDHGLSLCGQGDADRGLLWLARSLSFAERAGAADLERVIRGQLAAWSTRVHQLRGRLGHGQRIIKAAAISPDGRLVLLGGPNIAQLWDLSSDQPAGPPLAHSGTVVAAAFSSDGSRFLTAVRDGPAQLWDRAKGASLGPPLTHPGGLRAAALRRDGRVVVTVGGDGTARLWDAASGKPAGPILRPKSPAVTAAFRRDGQSVITGNDDGSATIWDTASGAPGVTVRASRAAVQAVAFSGDGRTVLTASRDWQAWLWDPSTGDKRREARGHLAPIEAAAFSPDGRLVLTGSRDGTARIWDAANAQPVGTPLSARGEVHALAFSPDGTTALIAGSADTADLWRLHADAARPQVLAIPGWAAAMAFSSDAHLLATGSDDGTARLWDVSTGHPFGPVFPHGDLIRALAFSPDGRTLATASEDKTARLWDVATGKPAGGPFPHESKLYSVAFRPDGKRLLTGTLDGTVTLWDIATGRAVARRLHCHDGPVLSLCFSPDGKRVLTASTDQTARLWRGLTLEPTGPPLRHDGQVWAVAFSPDGRLAASGGADKTARLWDAATGAPVGTPLVDHYSVRTLAFSGDGRSLFLGGWIGPSKLWDLTTARPLGAPVDHEGPLLALAFDRASNRILTASEDKAIRPYAVPPPMEGDPERISVWSQTITGLVLDEGGAVRMLTPEEWQARRHRLTTLGGPP